MEALYKSPKTGEIKSKIDWLISFKLDRLTAHWLFDKKLDRNWLVKI